MRPLAFFFILIFALTPYASFAQRRGGGGRAFEHRAPESRPAPPPRPQTPPGRPQGGGFDLHNDLSSQNRITQPVNRSTENVNRTNANANVNSHNTNVNNRNVNVNNRNVNVSGNNVYVNRTYVRNPVYVGPAWGWNRGVAWAPVPAYWGGGFWGGFAAGATTAIVMGSIVNAATHQTYSSYRVQPSSPGATLLSNYSLQQVPCGPPGLVVIYGPNNGVICANPNSLVAAGTYDIDTSNLSLVSR